VPSGARTTSLTRRGWTLAGAAGGLVVGSRVLGAGPLAGLGIAAALLLAFGFAWVALRTTRLTIDRRSRPARVHVGGEGLVVLEGIADTSTPLLTLTDRVDGGSRAARFVVAPQPARSVLRAAYRIPTTKRGRHVIGPLVASVADPIGVARRSWVVADATDIVVCPRVHDVAAPPRGGGGEPAAHADGARAPALEPLGEFLALREYEPGDDPRQVHWRSTARTGELVVRQDEAASPGRVILALDSRPAVHDEASFEHAIEAVASLGVRLRRERVPAEVVTTGGELLARPGPGAGELLLDRLAVVDLTPDDHLASVLGGLRNRLGIGTVVVATGAPDDALVDAIIRLRSRCVVILIATRPATARALPRGVIWVDCAQHPFPAPWNAAFGRHRTRSRRIQSHQTQSQWTPAASPSPSPSPR